MNKRICRRVSLSLPALLLLLAALSACADRSTTANAPAAATNAPGAANANTASPAPKSPLEGIVSASTETVELAAGETVETSVRLSITNGYHVNANPATEKFLIPTALNVKPEAGLTAGTITYPKPLKRKFAFAEMPLDVYEGDAVIKLKLNAARDAKPGQHTLRTDIRLQPCDEEKCYPPATLSTGIAVSIR